MEMLIKNIIKQSLFPKKDSLYSKKEKLTISEYICFGEKLVKIMMF